jgi:spore germination cell wall hydrolase CwlJ-like protein
MLGRRNQKGRKMFKFNTQKFNTLAVVLAVLTIVYTAPTLSREFITNTTQKQVSADYQKQVECLAKNIYYESAGETYEGKLAVAQVTLNRVNSGIFPRDICSVVYQKTTDQNLRTVCQFSWTCMVKEMVHGQDRYRWEESLLIAKRALTVPVLHDRISETNALYYHAVYVNPGWNKQKVVMKIGNHIFYSRI